MSAEYAEKNLAAADDFTGPFQEAMTALCWGVAGGTDVIDAKTRSMMNLSMIGALKSGVSQDETRAIIHVIAIYCGAPQGLECFRVERKVLKKQSVE